MNTSELITNFLSQAKDFSDAELWAAVDSLQTLLKPKSLQKKEAKASEKKEKKPKDPDAPKRTANAAILFTSQFIRPLMAALAESESDVSVKKEMLGVKCVSQVSATFWANLKVLGEDERLSAKEAITEKEVFEAYKAWKSAATESAAVITEPSAAVAEAEETASVTSTSSSVKSEKKAAKAAAKAAEKEATKAVKEAEKAAAKAAKEAEKAAAKAAKEAEKKPKKASKKAAEPTPEPEDDDAAAVPFSYEGRELFKTKDGRVYKEDGDWYGMYDSKTKKVDTTVPEPAYVN
jgi:hypothetical protein